MMSGKYLLLGSNLGDRLHNLREAKKKLGDLLLGIAEESSVYETAPWGNTNQPAFYNQVLKVTTDLRPVPLLHRLLETELEMGRKRLEKWGARIIDIDILYYDNLSINSEELTVPHPGIPYRKFTLVPLSEMAPYFVHPGTQKTNLEMLNSLRDHSKVIKVISGSYL